MASITPREEYKARHAERARAEQERAPKPWYWFKQREPVARFTMYVSILTGGLILVGVLQWIVISGQLDEMKNATRKDQRAWVSLISPKLSAEPVANEDASITYVGFNSGKTPALNMELREGIYIGTFDGPNGEPEIPAWRTVKTQRGAILFPQAASGTIRETMDATKITDTVVSAYGAQNSSSRIYLRVCLDYDDAFGWHHWVETCIVHKRGDAMDAFEQCETGVGIDPEDHPQKAQRNPAPCA